MHSVIIDRDGDLPRNSDATLRKLAGQKHLINALEQTRPQLPVHT